MFSDKVLLIDDKSSLSHYPDDPDDPHASPSFDFPVASQPSRPNKKSKVEQSSVADSMSRTSTSTETRTLFLKHSSIFKDIYYPCASVALQLHLFNPYQRVLSSIKSSPALHVTHLSACAQRPPALQSQPSTMFHRKSSLGTRKVSPPLPTCMTAEQKCRSSLSLYPSTKNATKKSSFQVKILTRLLSHIP